MVFSHTRGGGVNPKSTLFTLLKKCGFAGGGGWSWIQLPHFFRIFFLKNFVPFHPVSVSWKVILRVKLRNFFPLQNVFPHLRGGGGPGGVEKIHFFFEGFPNLNGIISIFLQLGTITYCALIITFYDSKKHY